MQCINSSALNSNKNILQQILSNQNRGENHIAQLSLSATSQKVSIFYLFSRKVSKRGAVGARLKAKVKRVL